MKALLVNGSPRAKGCTYTALTELAKTLEAEGIETETIHVGNKDVRGCIACRKCHTTGSGKCVFDDIVNEAAPKLAEADAPSMECQSPAVSIGIWFMAAPRRKCFRTKKACRLCVPWDAIWLS